MKNLPLKLIWDLFKNTITGYVYIGQTIDLRGRKTNHLFSLRHNTHATSHLQNAFNKYGEEAFIFMEIVKEVPNEELTNAERIELAKYVIDGRIDHTRCYNVVVDPEVNFPQIYWTEEQRLACSEAHKGDKNHFFGRHHKDESKKLISDAKQGVPLSEEAKKNMSIAQTGRTQSQETKDLLSEIRTGDKNPFHGKQHTEESRAKMTTS